MIMEYAKSDPSALVDGNIRVEAKDLAELLDAPSIKSVNFNLPSSSWVWSGDGSGQSTGHANQWRLDLYSSLGSSTSATPTPADFETKAIQSTTYITEATVVTKWSQSSAFSGILSTYIYSSIAQNLTITVYTDDGGAVYLNGNLISAVKTCTNTSVKLPLVVGENFLQVYCHNPSSTGAFQVTPSLSAQNNITKVSAESIGYNTQEIALEGINDIIRLQIDKIASKDTAWNLILQQKLTAFVENGKVVFYWDNTETIDVNVTGKIIYK